MFIRDCGFHLSIDHYVYKLPTNLSSPCSCQQHPEWTSTFDASSFLCCSKPPSCDAQPGSCSIYCTFLHINYCSCFILCFICPCSNPSSSSRQIKFIDSIRGKPKLGHDGYTYVYHKMRESGYIVWNNKAARDKGSACCDDWDDLYFHSVVLP